MGSSDWQRDRWPNFSPEELRCRETRTLLIVPGFMDKLQALRSAMGFAFLITSAYRHPTRHPAERAKARPGAHALGRAVDIALDPERMFQVVGAAHRFGFTGLGVSARPGAHHFLHLDDMQPGEFHVARPAVWSY
jgi:uncharacterized protein YcbK (DUF882 family)